MARKRLNTKLLIALACGVTIVAVGLFVAAKLYADSPERAVSRAEAAMKEGNWSQAAEQYGKAYALTQNADYQLLGVEAQRHQTTGEDAREVVGSIQGALNGLVASNPNNLRAVRELMRFHADDPYFAGPRASQATREVRRLSDLVLAQEPDDAEANILSSVATLNLSRFTSEQIPADEAEAARETLRETVPTNPLDGTGLETLHGKVQEEVQSILSQLQTPNLSQEEKLEIIREAQGKYNSFTALLDEVAAAAESAESRESIPTDTALLHARLGAAYDAAARLLGQLSMQEVRQENPDASSTALTEAINTAANPLQEKALAQYDKAVAALDPERDVKSDAFLLAHTVHASALRNRGDTEAAEAELRKLVEQRPWDVRAAGALSQLLRETNRPMEAAEVMRKTFAASKEPLPDIPGRPGYRATLYRTLAGLHLADALLDARGQTSNTDEQRKLLDEAREAFAAYETARQASGGVGETIDSQRVEGELQIANRNFGEGINTLNAALRAVESGGGTDADRLSLLRSLAAAHRAAENEGAEIEYLEKAIAAGNSQGNAARMANDMYRLAQLHQEVGDDEEARKIAEQLLRIAPNLPQIQALLATLASEAEGDEAYANLPESTELERRIKLQTALNTNRREEVRRLAEALVAEQPQNPTFAVQLAQILAELGETEQAVTLLQKFPDDRAASRYLAQLQGGTEALLAMLGPIDRLKAEAQIAEAEGDTATMVAKLEEAHEAAPDDLAITQALFNAYVRAGRADEAEALLPPLRQASVDRMGGQGLDLQLLLARATRSNATGESGSVSLDSVIQAADRLVTNNQGIAMAHILRGDVYRVAAEDAEQQFDADLVAQRLNEAAESYAEAVRLSPTEIRALTGAITTLQSLKRYDEAQTYITEGLEAAPRNAFLRNAQAAIALRTGQGSGILQSLRTEVDTNADSVEPRLRLVRALQVAAAGAADRKDTAAAQQFHADAIAAIEAGLEAFPQDTRLLTMLADSAPAAGGDATARAEAHFAEIMRPTAENSLADSQEAVEAAVQFYANVGRPAEAEAIVRRYLSLMGDASREAKAGVLLELSKLLANQGKVLEAVDVLDGYEELPAIRQQRVRLLANAASADASVLPRLREELAQTSDLPTGTLNAAALAEYRAGNLAEAEALLKQANVEGDADGRGASPPGLFLLGVVEAGKSDADLNEAARLLQKSVELQPSNTDALRALAQVRRALGQDEAAEGTLRDLLDVSPTDVAARLALAQLQLDQRPPDYRAASREFRAAEAAGVGNDPRLLLARANMEADRNDANAAAGYARQAVEQATTLVRQAQPDVAPAALINQTANFQNAYLQLLLRLDRAEEALGAARALVNQLGDTAQVPYWIRRAEGEALARLGRPNEAVAAYTQAFEAAPPQARGTVLADANEHIGFDAAYALIRDGVEGEEPNPESLLLAATLYAEVDQLDQAISATQRIGELLEARGGMTPAQAMELDQRLGTLYLRSTPPRLDEAIAAYRRVLDQQADLAPALNNLAYALTLKGTQPGTPTAEAKTLLSEAVDAGTRAFDQVGRGPDGRANPNVLDSLGWAEASLAMLTNNGSLLESATNRLREAAETAEANGEPFAEVYYHLARVREAANQPAEARQFAQRGLEVIREREQSGEANVADEGSRSRLQEVLNRLGSGEGQ